MCVYINTMEFIVSELNDSEEVNQYKKYSSDGIWNQFLNRYNHSITTTASPTGSNDTDLGNRTTYITFVALGYPFHISPMSTLHGLSVV